MSITSEKVLRKMNEIQSKGGPSIGHWHILRRWLLEDEQVQETFQEAVLNDPDMTPEQKEYWLSQSRPTQRAADGVWTCVCGEIHFEGGVYCDVCGTDRPRR